VGACTRQTIDCSGLIQRIYRTTFGVVLPRNTRCQSQRGRSVSVAQSREGDVVFFRGAAGLHVGMFLSNGHVLHASYRRHRIAIDTLRELKQSLQVTDVRRMVEPRQRVTL
jgi:lipoprotein Spr/probable lipoprotein NlpC